MDEFIKSVVRFVNKCERLAKSFIAGMKMLVSCIYEIKLVLIKLTSEIYKNINSKRWYIYKHTKKVRTRKKMEKRLQNEIKTMMIEAVRG